MTRTLLPPQENNPELVPPAQPTVNPLWLIVALLTILVVASLALAYNFYRQSQGLPVPSISPTPTVPVVTPTIPVLSLVPSPVTPVSESISWNSSPVTHPALDIFKSLNQENTSEYTPSKAKYYQVATLPQGQKLVLAYVPTQGMGEFDTILRVVVDGPRNFLVPTPDSQNYFDNLLDGNKISTWTYQIPELNPPERLFTTDDLKGDYKMSYTTTDKFESLPSPQLVQDFPTGALYYTKNQVSGKPSGIFGLNYYFRLKDNTLVRYIPTVPGMNDDQKPNITWEDRSENSTSFNTRLIGGCGSESRNDNYSLSPEFISQKVHSGYMFNESQPQYEVFQVTDPNHPLVGQLYNNYKVGRESEPGFLNINDFAKQHNHFIWKDKMGNYLLFISANYQPMAECGKPVIYLYPQVPTQVSVKVGAKITQSEPLYSSIGWQVLAQPDGSLNYQGQNYPYLFWEGQGNGLYPDYRDQGFVVAQQDLIATVNRHLRLLGLNQKESADFMEFWQPRLPSTPFVRLTWLGTADMNRLAPLKVSPRPDTTIRLFLEFEGLDSPITLKPQKLSAPKRTGFTLVEWGGLLFK
ncbi:MAG: hypothetical protein WCT01_04200 [Candidatus Shapirobacteria bacterium]